MSASSLLIDFEHGTYAGYQKHLRRKSPPCLVCRLASNKYMQEYRRQGRDNELRSRGYGQTCVRGLGWPR